MTEQEKSAAYQRVGLRRCYGIEWSVVGRRRMPRANGCRAWQREVSSRPESNIHETPRLQAQRTILGPIELGILRRHVLTARNDGSPARIGA